MWPLSEQNEDNVLWGLRWRIRFFLVGYRSHHFNYCFQKNMPNVKCKCRSFQCRISPSLSRPCSFEQNQFDHRKSPVNSRKPANFNTNEHVLENNIFFVIIPNKKLPGYIWQMNQFKAVTSHGGLHNIRVEIWALVLKAFEARISFILCVEFKAYFFCDQM